MPENLGLGSGSSPGYVDPIGGNNIPSMTVEYHIIVVANSVVENFFVSLRVHNWKYYNGSLFYFIIL